MRHILPRDDPLYYVVKTYYTNHIHPSRRSQMTEEQIFHEERRYALELRIRPTTGNLFTPGETRVEPAFHPSPSPSPSPSQPVQPVPATCLAPSNFMPGAFLEDEQIEAMMTARDPMPEYDVKKAATVVATRLASGIPTRFWNTVSGFCTTAAGRLRRRVPQVTRPPPRPQIAQQPLPQVFPPPLVSQVNERFLGPDGLPVRKRARPDSEDSGGASMSMNTGFVASQQIQHVGSADLINGSNHFVVPMDIDDDDQDPTQIETPTRMVYLGNSYYHGFATATRRAIKYTNPELAPYLANRHSSVSPKSNEQHVHTFPESEDVPFTSAVEAKEEVSATSKYSSEGSIDSSPEPKEDRPADQLDYRVWGKLPDPEYKSIEDFFDEDYKRNLPGLDELVLTPRRQKLHELTVQRDKRERREREEAEKLKAKQQAAALAALGLRSPEATLITAISQEWNEKVRRAPTEGKIEPTKWRRNPHPDGVSLGPHDFSKIVPESAWLNDDVIHASLVCLATYVNDAASIAPKRDTPKCVAISSLYWTSFSQDESKLFPRPFGRKWGMTPKNFLDIETVLIPVNLGNHWTLLVIRPTRRTIAYVDSFHSTRRDQLQHAYNWLKGFLGDAFKEDDWKTVRYDVPLQTNGYDCGMFVITNAIYLALGIDPSTYRERDMPLQRRRITAMLLHGGFTDEFDLRNL